MAKLATLASEHRRRVTGSLYLLQNSSAINENVSDVDEDRPSHQVLDVYLPQPSIVVPVCSNNLMRELEVLHQAIFINEVFEVLPNFCCGGIETRPIWISSPSKLQSVSTQGRSDVFVFTNLIANGWNIASATWISICIQY